MIERLIEFMVRLMDVLLGWLLRFPSDVQLFAVALGSALVLIGVRACTTNQDLLRRCRDDQTRQKALIREAKARGGGVPPRHRAILAQIALKQFRQEGRPLLVSLLPIALLATWAFHRLEFHPPAAGESLQLTAHFPLSAAGRLVHIAPSDGLRPQNGWIQEVAPAGDHSEATWRLATDEHPAHYVLRVRFGGRTYEHPVRVGAPTYDPVLKTHDEHLLATELKLRPVKLFGLVPGLPALRLPAWLAAYLLIVIPSVPLLKRVLRVC